MQKIRKLRSKKIVVNVLNRILRPAASTYRSFRDILRKAKKAAPLIYEEVESIIKSNLITIDRKNKEALKAPDASKFSNIITSNLVKRLPGVEDEHLREMLADKKSKSFINALVKAFGASREQEKDYTVLEREKLFNRILIANRGEIALRVIRACRELGVEVVTVYTEQDKDALTVKMSDKAYYIGDTPLAYLDMAKIIATAKKAKADAIHPGYGFLAENADFADMCEKNKIKFIGPSSKTIKALGDKVQAKNISRKANVPIIIGTRTLKDAKEAGKDAEKIGYPVILKASAGGGGKGMRVVRSEKEIEKSLTAAQNEALASFKDKSVYMEKYVENPSPALNEELREKMGSAAVRAVSSVKYLGAGTVEFLLDADGKFYFIEVNTRIQVEHGVTEMVTGVDLVKEQIKLTAGAKLAFSQSDIELDGHAIECRINAEDPTEDFAPSVGTISNYLPPGGPGIRVNSICHTGYRVSADYDSLL